MYTANQTTIEEAGSAPVSSSPATTKLASPVTSGAADEQIKPYRRLHYMYGAVAQIELNGFLEANSIDTDERKRAIKSEWRKAAQEFQVVVATEAGTPDAVHCGPLPPGASAYLEKIKATAAFKETFANYPVTFEEIEIDKIVACQRTVHMDYVEALINQYQHSSDNLLDFCLNPGRDAATFKVGRSAGNAYTFSSPNPSLRLLGCFEQAYGQDLQKVYHPGGQPVHAVTLLVGYGSSTVNTYRVGKRLILNNGFHRLYALRSRGVEYAPVVVQHVTHPELELPDKIADLPKAYVVSAPRPGLMKDFFNPAFCCEIRQRNFIKSLQVAWGTNEGIVPV